jgi:hypothetical protein
MKLHFSDCGRYLHIVVLEGQRRWQSMESTSFLGRLPVKLAVVVLTYRLSISKTARSPPVLIHRLRVDAGKRFSLSASKIPFTVTWRPQDVYVSCSSHQLTVFRISLFKEGSRKGHQDMSACPVMTLQKPLLLPGTALERPVYYFPPSAGNKPAALILAGEPVPRRKDRTTIDGESSPKQSFPSLNTITSQSMYIPIGCFVHEDQLGGWVKSDARTTLAEDRGVGSLDTRLNYYDDCDRELLFLLKKLDR